MQEKTAAAASGLPTKKPAAAALKKPAAAALKKPAAAAWKKAAVAASGLPGDIGRWERPASLNLGDICEWNVRRMPKDDLEKMVSSLRLLHRLAPRPAEPTHYPLARAYVDDSRQWMFSRSYPTDRPIRVGCMCSGTLSWLPVMQHIQKKLPCRLPFKHMFCCEWDTDKQNFIMANFMKNDVCDVSPFIMFGDVKELGNEYAMATDGRGPPGRLVRCLVPEVDLVFAGFSCKSVSRQNNGRTDNAACITEATGNTGETWSGVAAYLQRHRPAMVLLENVCGLKDRIKGEESQLTDVLRTLETMGYAAGWTECNTVDYHLPQRRPRLWIWAWQMHVAETASGPSAPCDATSASGWSAPWPASSGLPMPIETAASGLPTPAPPCQPADTTVLRQLRTALVNEKIEATIKARQFISSARQFSSSTRQCIPFTSQFISSTRPPVSLQYVIYFAYSTSQFISSTRQCFPPTPQFISSTRQFMSSTRRCISLQRGLALRESFPALDDREWYDPRHVSGADREAA
jgi:site-specific DNA-cytosine methylase